MKTIAEQLGITNFPFKIKNERGNEIYKEWEDGFWARWEFDEQGNYIYFENSYGRIIDNRPKPKTDPNKMTIEINGKKFKLVEV